LLLRVARYLQNHMRRTRHAVNTHGDTQDVV
jgi:hypothetical protein